MLIFQLSAGVSADSLDSLDEFGGFDMTRSHSVDGLFSEAKQVKLSMHMCFANTAFLNCQSLCCRIFSYNVNIWENVILLSKGR